MSDSDSGIGTRLADSRTPTVRVQGSVDDALEAVAHAAELWGGEWSQRGTGGRLEIPVAAGIRRGTIQADVTTRREGPATTVELHTVADEYRLQGRELAVLMLGAAGGLFLVVAPFVPELFDLIPMAGLLLLLAWFLVVSRLRNRNAVDFLAEVQKISESADEPTD